MGRLGDGETRRLGDGETRRWGDWEMGSVSILFGHFVRNLLCGFKF